MSAIASAVLMTFAIVSLLFSPSGAAALGKPIVSRLRNAVNRVLSPSLMVLGAVLSERPSCPSID